MEFSLNLAWTLLSVLILCLWLRVSRRDDTNRRMQFLAIVALILILFPVISVTDDLQAALNPAETDTCLRRDYGIASVHPFFPAISALPPLVPAALAAGALRFAGPVDVSVPVVEQPALSAIRNRPPPAA